MHSSIHFVSAKLVYVSIQNQLRFEYSHGFAALIFYQVGSYVENDNVHFKIIKVSINVSIWQDLFVNENIYMPYKLSEIKNK